MALATKAGCAVAAVAALVLLVLLGRAANAAPNEGEASVATPRFGTLHWDKVNLRSGPGTRYPIEWVLTHKDMPVEITGKFEEWRRIRDWQGTEGWVHERTLTDRRGVVVTAGVHALYRGPEPGAAIVARAEAGVVGRLIECRGPWCKIDTGDVDGWIRRSEVWGVLPNEAVP